MKRIFIAPLEPLIGLALLSVLLLVVGCGRGAAVFCRGGEKDLAEGFVSPADEYRPWCYWFWLNGHVDRETACKDLEAIKEAGFSGILIVDPRGYWDDDDHVRMAPAEIEFMSDEWVDNVCYALKKADSLGLEVTINLSSCGGSFKGPWLLGEDCPKRLMHKAMPLKGGKRCDITLDVPEDLPFYRDVALFAVRHEEALAPDTAWMMSGDGSYDMSATSGRKMEGGTADTSVKALEVVELTGLAITGDATGSSGSLPSGLPHLCWDVPEGNWTLLRFGSSTIPGFEHDVDVLDPNAVRRHIERIVEPIRRRVPALVGKTLTHFYSVSWEGAVPTWSPQFEEDFNKFTGRDLRPLMPMLAGFEIEDGVASGAAPGVASGAVPDVASGAVPGVASGAATGHPGPRAAFMQQYRKARNDMFRVNFYRTMRDMCHSYGVKMYSECGGPWVRRPEVFQQADQLEFLSLNDMPQGEFWCEMPATRMMTRGISAAAHLYGKKRCSVEAFTHMTYHWSMYPDTLKQYADQVYLDGINHFVWHTFTCSPDKFGVPGGEYFAGTHVNRNVTWFDEVRPFVDYLARCQFMLQRGLPVVDLAVWGGDRVYQHWGHYRDRPYDSSSLVLPRGFNYDLINTDALVSRCRAENGRIVLPDGMSYGALILDPEFGDCMSAEVKAKIEELRRGSVKVLDGRLLCSGSSGTASSGSSGTAPSGTSGSSGTAPSAGGAFPDASSLGMLPDFEGKFPATHRKVGRTDIYFVAGEGWEDMIFRSSGDVQLWDAVSGSITRAESEPLPDGRTKVRLDLPHNGSVFVVFNARANADKPLTLLRSVTLEGPWDASFSYHKLRSAPPAPRQWTQLHDLSTDPDPDVAHFSGTVTLRCNFTVPGLEEGPHVISLGKVEAAVAHVYLNGVDCGTLWTAPWETDVTPALRQGVNTLEIAVTNTWQNLLIADCARAQEDRITTSGLHYFQSERRIVPGRGLVPTIYSGYSSRDSLQRNGVLGPVRLKSL